MKSGSATTPHERRRRRSAPRRSAANGVVLRRRRVSVSVESVEAVELARASGEVAGTGQLTPSPVESAESAGLRYVNDGEPGISRRGAGKGFRYVDADGRPVKDEATLARIRRLAIPPAWTEVWICRSERGHIQATGRDARGRKQYRYHPRWREVRDETKYDRMLAFGAALPAIRAASERDLALPGLPREKVLAAVVRLLDETSIRVGNDEYARDNDSYGLTTLHDEHVEIEGSLIRFHFRGKGGKEHAMAVRDRRLARIVKRCQDVPGRVSARLGNTRAVCQRCYVHPAVPDGSAVSLRHSVIASLWHRAADATGAVAGFASGPRAPAGYARGTVRVVCSSLETSARGANPQPRRSAWRARG
ncbi:DNA topoisomerase IB [Sorangium sp. So ce281]|uniref:DNA topoisomerase IB n=1 Tax=Sorangium sp. So ce281 TaxID=3133293 RepID=UPI003F5FC551